MKKTPFGPQVPGTLILREDQLEIRAFEIPIPTAKKLLRKKGLGHVDEDDLSELTEKYVDAERSVWSGRSSVIELRWNDDCLPVDPPPEKARHRAVRFEPRGAELVLVEHSYDSCSVDLLSPFQTSKLRVSYSFHRLGKNIRWAAAEVRYEDEEFDEYIWADGSQPIVYGNKADCSYFLFMKSPNGFSETSLV